MSDDGTGPSAASLGSARLYCEACGRETPHRLLRVQRGRSGAGPSVVAGLARCRDCRWVHPFVSRPEDRVSVEVVTSRGPTSQRERRELPPSDLLEVGRPVPGVEAAGGVRRIERRDGTSVAKALARDVRTVWLAREGPPQLRLAVLEGSRSRTVQLPRPTVPRLAVGDRLAAPGGAVTIVALRAHGRTWRRAGDAFAPAEVGVAYGRRTESPPAGRSAWRAERPMPSSRASSDSRAARSRSSPGVRRKRSSPRARTASFGATQR